MGVPVVVARNNIGYPIRPVNGNAPTFRVSENGRGVAVVISERGLPVILDGYNTGPEIRFDGDGYAGTVVTSTMAGIWYVDGVAVGAGFSYTIRPEDEGKPIYLRTEPAIWVKYGQSGYAGSVYQANFIGQFYADGVKIPGAIGEEWTMTPELEGAEITFSYEPVIWIDGSGYAGSVYRSNLPVVWYANGVAVPDAVGYEWVMTPQYEGAEISASYELAIYIESGNGYAGSVIAANGTGVFVVDGVARSNPETKLTVTPEMEGKTITFEGEITPIEDRPEVNMQSNTIQMFAPITLDTSYKTTGGQWGADIQTTVTRGGVEYVTAWSNRFGGADMEQATAANQPTATTASGQPAAMWDKSPAFQSLIATSTLTAKWGFAIAQFGNGTESVTAASTGAALYAYLLSRGGGTGNAVCFANTSIPTSNATEAGVRVNGAETEIMTDVLPLPISSLSWSFNASNQVAATLGIGYGFTTNQDRQWVGPISSVLLLAEIPTTEERQKIEGYYHWKYGMQALLPTGHPYRNNPPRIQ